MIKRGIEGDGIIVDSGSVIGSPPGADSAGTEQNVDKASKPGFNRGRGILLQCHPEALPG